MDKILIENYEVVALHGVNPEEKVNPQRFLVSVEMSTDFYKAAKTDDLDKTASYSAVCKVIKSFVGENSFDLIETIACRLAKKILLTFSNLTAVKVTVKKPDAPMKGVFDYVGVSTELAWHRVYLGLGSNMGDRHRYLDLAVNMLEGDDNFRSLRESTRIESEPYGGVADMVFVNSVIEAQTLYTPRQLLDVVHGIEKAGDRVRKERWGNRTLDLDILFYDDIVLDEPDLSIPHPDTHNRDFVLNPLRELNEYLMHPFLRKRVKDLKPEKLTFPTEEK